MLIENRRPGIAEVGGLPDAAVHRGYVKNVGLLRDSSDRHCATAAKRSDAAPAHLRIKFRIVLLRANGKSGEDYQQQAEHTNNLERNSHSFPPGTYGG